MEDLYVQLAAILVAILSGGIAVFQILLFLGFPLGEYSWGGKYKGVLPKKIRMMSLPAAVLGLFFGLVFLMHTNLLTIESILPTNILVWVITVFLGLNTLGNLASRSKKEKVVMGPIAAITFLSCLFISIFGK
ncbi:hypothetical protein ACFSCX_21310 [Bacillus salitolerans]|uniref:Uncharacterized protein n=1 Tax=Bacillus salitolerans TaxID=1437434 RepID=A0ABW4LVG9_9BACI